MLVLPIKKKWFDMIKAGEKLEEYREIKPYYDKRLLNYFEHSDYGSFVVINPYIKKQIILRNGYKRESPSLLCLCTLDMGTGKEEWGAKKDKKYYILKILKAEEITKKPPKTKERKTKHDTTKNTDEASKSKRVHGKV